MFARRESPTLERHTPADEEPPAVAQGPVRPKVDAKDAAIFQPSSFASRKAEAQARGDGTAPLLVFMGVSEQTVTTNTRGDVRVVEVALYHEKQHPARRWFRMLPHGQLTPMFEADSNTDTVTPIGRVRGGLRFPNRYPDAAPDEP